MEKRGKKLICKKILVIFCIFALLQGYISALSQVVMAFEEEIPIGPGGSIFDQTTGDNGDNNQDEIISDDSQNDNDENVTSEESENTVENEVSNEVENEVEEDEISSEPVENETEENQEEEQSEEPEEEQTEETQEEEPIEDQEEEQSEEPYVEPSVALEVSSENPTIYKGYLYANATSDLKYATDYNTIDKLDIVGGKNMTSLTVQDEPDKFQLITNNKVGLMNQMYYRQTRVSVDEFHNILGEDGIITLYTSSGDVIGEINSYTEEENGEYVYTYSSQFDSVKFELTNIKNDGSISFKNDKSIKETSDFSRNQISLFSSINTVANLNMQVGDVNTPQSAEGNINLEETESCMSLDLDTDTLSVEEPNDVTISVTLKTNSEKYDLFENPTVDIEFPSAAKSVEITGINLLYKNGLSIESYNVVKNAYGNNVLKVALTGAQLEYTPGTVQEGTTIVINTRVDIDRLTADTQESLKMTYTNKDTVRKSYTLEGKDSEDVIVSLVGRKELVRALELTDSNNSSVTSYDEATEKIQLTPNQEQVIGITGAIVNNYETTLNDVVIVGRIPFVGNKDMNGNDLGSNFDTKLQGAISTTGVVSDVYYSEDGLAESNSDSWSLDVTDFSNIKSFKIVVRDKDLAKGDKLYFSYNLVIPNTVGYNAKSYTNYFVNYKIDTQNYFNQCSGGLVTEEKEIDMGDITDDSKQDVAQLTIGTQVSQGGTILGETDTVYERQILKYTIVVSNNSKITANNVVIRANAENANLYYFNKYYYTNGPGEEGQVYIGEYQEDDGTKGYEEFTIDSLKPDETRTFEFQVVVKNLDEIENPEVYGKITVSSDTTGEQEITTIKNQIVEGKIELRVTYSGTVSADDPDLFSNSGFKFEVYAKNISGVDLKNVDLNVYLPDTVDFVKIENTNRNYKYDAQKTADGTIVTIHFDNMEADYEDEIFFISNVKNFDLNIYKITLKVLAKAEVDNEEYVSNDFLPKARQTKGNFEYSWTSDLTKDPLDNGDVITYTLKFKNIGVILINYLSVVDEIPDGLVIQKVSLTTKDGTTDLEYDSQSRQIFENLPKVDIDDEVTLTIKAVVDSSSLLRDQKTIENKLQINGGAFFDEFNTNVISYNVNNNYTSSSVEEDVPDEQTTQDEEQTQPAEYTETEEYTSNEDETNNNNNNNQNINNRQNNTEVVPDNQNDNNENEQSNEQSNQEPAQRETQNTQEQPQAQTQTITYYISGLAWIDSNQDGIRQASEKLKNGVVVSLYKANSNGGLDTSNLVKTTGTDSEGKYTFSGIEQGKYIIVFDYNASRYKLTKYQVETATSTENSDAISKKITIGGATNTLGVTDVLDVTDSSLYSIDIGLIDNTNFDLKLDKTISKVEVKNESGNKKYNFKNSKDAKIEIRSKDYKSSVLDITYNIKITNKGDVSGYVSKVVDYLPDDIEVVLNSSPGWYIGSDNGLYYNGLNDQEIKPGESKDCTLVLRKSLASGEAVKVANSAEIAESTNPYELEDRNSINNNKEPSEDDYGTALLTVSISTGNTVNYIISSLLMIIMIAVIARVVIKFKTTKKIYR